MGKRKAREMNTVINLSAPTKQNDTNFNQFQKDLSPAKRRFSLAELTLGSAIVIGHNVYHLIPNEVHIFFVFALILLRLRTGGCWVVGLRWPVACRRPVLVWLGEA